MHNIRLSKLASEKLNGLLDYLEEEWSLNVALDFENIFGEKLAQVAAFPESCPKSKTFKDLHICIVTKQTSSIYRVRNNDVEIITIFDNRSSFKSITKEIRKYYGQI
ncbi:type II toxin-antitoxin system RelE/ParE family toxin [Flavobacterium coralii]|jgi:plasmid stabilization system protein ParE|uniref:type II toxin-antitoxin system RelE/ParE family toxin n=1 Tax=Flavobacterium coralii TaxID=2838017 RepID=UPI000C49BD49|nr:plasmid stabilization protein [Flavobacterium sp.]|tara:strand:- start:32143 stop:32463 length:321 start_codon:yes stop_codon:yes gene_type:complete